MQSQQRTAAAQAAGRFDAEIVPITATRLVKDRATGETRAEEVTPSCDEGNRPGTTPEALAQRKPARYPCPIPALPDGAVHALDH